jgi:hypothetical protein
MSCLKAAFFAVVLARGCRSLVLFLVPVLLSVLCSFDVNKVINRLGLMVTRTLFKQTALDM